MASDFNNVFTRLKGLLERYEPYLVVVHDKPDHYYLDARVFGPNGKPLFFGAVSIMKNYVSFYLMPAYLYPELLNGISPALKKRMQGKSCFNFKKVDEVLFEELAALTVEGYQRLKREMLNG